MLEEACDMCRSDMNCNVCCKTFSLSEKYYLLTIVKYIKFFVDIYNKLN